MSPPTAAAAVSTVARERLRAAPGTPLVTFVDHTTGERTELSAATLDNWASKTANLLVEEYDLAPGDRVGLVAGPHWSTAAILLGCMKAGACVVPGATDGVRLVVVEEAAGVGAADGLTREAPSADPGIEEAAGVGAVLEGVPVVVVGAGMGARLTGPLPPGALGYGEEVLAFADDYDDPDVDAGTDAVLLDGVRLTQGDLLAAVAAYGERGLGGGGRVLVTQGPEAVEGLLGVLGPLAWGGAAVVVRGADPARLWDTIATEGVTAALLPGSLLDRLGPPPGSTPLQRVLCPSGVAGDVARRAEERIGVPVAVVPEPVGRPVADDDA